jgi:hypothetical protein
MGSNRRSFHEPLLRDVQGRGSWRCARAPGSQSPSRFPQGFSRYSSLSRRAVSISPLHPWTLPANHIPAPTASTSFGPTATTAASAPKMTRSIAPLLPVLSPLSALCLEPLTPLAPAARLFMRLLARRQTTLTLRAMLLTRTHTS